MGVEKSLPVPLAAEVEESSEEVLRVWSIKKRYHPALNMVTMTDPSAWGTLLCHIARQVAKAFEQAGTLEREAAQKQILDGMEAEFARIREHTKSRSRPAP